jgi:hypothetical protein
MNRSDLAFASFVDGYEFNPTCRPVSSTQPVAHTILNVELNLLAEDHKSLLLKVTCRAGRM